MANRSSSTRWVEFGVLTGTVLALGIAIYLLRHTEHSEPRPGHEPD